jgi:hypothetical protein
MLYEHEWLKEWKGFIQSENPIVVPVIIVPGEAKYKKTFNIIISSNHEAPRGTLEVKGKKELYWGWDSRDAVKSLELAGLGGSSLIFDIGGEFKSLDSLLITNQVDMVIVNNSRSIYDQNELGYIEKFAVNNNIRIPLMITPMKINPDFHKDNWFKGYDHLFRDFQETL